MEESWWALLKTDFDALSYEVQNHFYYSFYQFAYKEIFFILKDHFLVEDIIQESFLKAIRNHGQLKEPLRGKKWVKRIIRNQMIDILKQKKVVIG
ncbi:RNA polymerase sigma factor [Paenibacillus sp. SYP-B4298]|uniref:RNA polymerase sigma factor n=1 Tax=Paenibacillus sp. SYP-B4298 TaxID=2996034 RepID=UPI0022DE59C5|nr:sigma factor [Paenibacillus sp. SYP-B4298]